jgi:hypothetical protein
MRALVGKRARKTQKKYADRSHPTGAIYSLVHKRHLHTAGRPAVH